MRKLNTKIIILSLAAAASTAAIALPTLASADCYDRKQNAQTKGAIVGAVAGAALGNTVAGRRDKGAGTVLGAVVGAAVGSNIARSNTHCYYDNGGYYSGNYYGGSAYYDRGANYAYDDRRDSHWDRRDDRRDDRDNRDDRRDWRDDHR